MKGILKNLLGLVTKFIDSDGDGKIELSDLPGTLAKVAALEAQGKALVSAAVSTVKGFRDLAKAGQLTDGGTPITAEQVEAAWEQAKVPFTTAADEARAALGQQ